MACMLLTIECVPALELEEGLDLDSAGQGFLVLDSGLDF